MLGIIVAIGLALVGILASSVMTKNRREKAAADVVDMTDGGKSLKPVTYPTYVGVVAAVLVIIMSCIAVVPTGYTGILTTFGRVENNTIGAGINFIAPWQSVVKMDNRTQKVQIETSAFSSDIQQVDLVLSLNYCIDQTTAQELYRTVGVNYYDSIIYPRMLENTKAVFSQYTAENLINKRNKLSEQIVEVTAADMQGYGITVVSMAIEDIDFTDAFTNAVEAKQVAAQNKLTAETEQAQMTMEEEQAAKRAVIQAEADAEVRRVQADANLYEGEKEAEMNQRIGESLTQELIEYYRTKQWDGKLPQTVLGSDGNYMLDLG